jgi:hypothetical protein
MKKLLILATALLMAGCEIYYSPPTTHTTYVPTHTPTTTPSVVEACSLYYGELECDCLEFHGEWYEAELCWDYYYYSYCYTACEWVYYEYYDEYEEICWEECY